MEKREAKKNRIKIIPLIICVGAPLLIGIVVNKLLPNTQEIYNNLSKPIFAAPSQIFPIVWTILYILMGIASYIVYLKKIDGIDVSSALFVYEIQLLLNFLWSFLFFGLRLYGISFIELVILFIFASLTAIRFYKKAGVKASLLLAPYLIWLVYAGVLNFYIWMLNEM